MCDMQGALRCVLTVSAAYIAHDNVRMGSHHFDGMGWDGMGWDWMGWDGMGWDGM